MSRESKAESGPERAKRGRAANRKKNVRGSKFTMLLSKDEQAKLHELAGQQGVPASVYLRMLIRSEGAKLNGSARKSNGAG